LRIVFFKRDNRKGCTKIKGNPNGQIDTAHGNHKRHAKGKDQ
jgi:hypothetical protein